MVLPGSSVRFSSSVGFVRLAQGHSRHKQRMANTLSISEDVGQNRSLFVWWTIELEDSQFA